MRAGIHDLLCHGTPAAGRSKACVRRYVATGEDDQTPSREHALKITIFGKYTENCYLEGMLSRWGLIVLTCCDISPDTGLRSPGGRRSVAEEIVDAGPHTEISSAARHTGHAGRR